MPGGKIARREGLFVAPGQKTDVMKKKRCAKLLDVDYVNRAGVSSAFFTSLNPLPVDAGTSAPHWDRRRAIPNGVRTKSVEKGN